MPYGPIELSSSSVAKHQLHPGWSDLTCVVVNPRVPTVVHTFDIEKYQTVNKFHESVLHSVGGTRSHIRKHCFSHADAHLNHATWLARALHTVDNYLHRVVATDGAFTYTLVLAA